MIVIKREAYEDMLAHARGCAGEMACGVVSGKFESGRRVVYRFHPVTNTAHCPERFALSRQELSRVMTSLTGSGNSAVGTWFSHPGGDAVMTAYEIATAHDRDGSYLVLSLADADAPVLRSYRVWGGRADEEPLQIE